MHFYAAEIHVEFVRLGCVAYAYVAPDWVAECWSDQHGLPAVRHLADRPAALSGAERDEMSRWAGRLADASDDEIWEALLSSPA
jgi:hypothetical protein